MKRSTIILVLMVFQKVIIGQSLSLEGLIFNYFSEKRPTAHKNFEPATSVATMFSFSDSITNNLEYNTGIAYVEIGEALWTDIPSGMFPFITFETYEANYISFKVGATYRIKGFKNNGFYVSFGLLPSYRVSASLRMSELNSLGDVLNSKREAPEAFSKFVLLSMTSFGYQIAVYNNFYLSAGLGLSARVGRIDDTRDDNFYISNSCELGVSYRF